MKKNNFSFVQKLYFYTCHIFYKILIPLDCKKGRLSLIMAEIIFLVIVIFKIKIKMPNKLSTSVYITKFGKFTIDPSDVQSAFIISPAFERLDKQFLLSLIKNEIDNLKKVLFIDIGAHVGTYTIMVGNAFKKERDLFIYAFEPDAIGFAEKSFTLLKKNVADNKITNIKLFHIGLGSKNSKTLNKAGIITRRLDSIIKPSIAKNFDSIFIKIDIEGYEKDALEGAREFLNNTKKAILLIEDYVNKDIIPYLEKRFDFYKKITPYNAFWIKEKNSNTHPSKLLKPKKNDTLY